MTQCGRWGVALWADGAGTAVADDASLGDERLTTVPGDGWRGGLHVGVYAFKVEVPGVGLGAVGVPPDFKAGVGYETRGCEGCGEDGGFEVACFFRCRLRKDRWHWCSGL